MGVSVRKFGETGDGQAVSCYRMEAEGAFAEVLDYGCTVHRLVVPDRQGQMVDVCLGYDTVAEYQENDGYLGAVIGRHANRIGGSRFELNGNMYPVAANDGENHLHGGIRGFDKYIWQAEMLGDGVKFFRHFPDGDEGYPGGLNVWVTYRFEPGRRFTLRYEAVCDADTVINMTNHCYFNLNGSGSGDVLGQELQLNADFYTPNSPGCLPDGRVLPVDGTVFDFRAGKALGRDLEADEPQLAAVGGFDHNFILRGRGMRAAGVLRSPDTGICMEIATTQPGLQVYTGNVLTARRGKGGAAYGVHHAVCLETQHFPNSMNLSQFPSVVLRRGERYDETTAYTFGNTGGGRG